MNKVKNIIGLACLIGTIMLISGAVMAASGKNYSWKGYPETAKTPEDTTLLIERFVPNTVRPGEEYTYELKLTNRSAYRLDEIILKEKIPANFKITEVMPTPKKRGNVMMWKFDFMAPNQKEIISITGKALKPGKITHRGNADLNFHLGQMNAIMEVVNPSLLFGLEAPKNVIVQQDFPVKLKFKNNGTASVLGAYLEHTFKNFKTARGNNKVKIEIGNLNPGDSKEFILHLKGIRTGEFTNKLVAKAKEGVTASKTMVIKVTQPKLEISGTAPKMRYVGNKISYRIKVKNTGNGEAKNLRVKLTLPSGTKFASATEGGKPIKNDIVWNFGSLNSNEEKSFKASVIGTKIMLVPAKATAVALGTNIVSTSFSTDVQGIPALLLVVNDVNDPVPIGGNEIYKIIIKNQGSLSATEVQVQCQLEDSMELVSTDGPTTAAGEKNGVVMFKPLTALGVGETATWTVVVKAKSEGDVRFGASVKCKQLQRRVSEFESTEFYAD